MGSVSNLVEKNVTKVATSTGSKMLEKLNGKGNNISTITFPHNLENEAQATYMVIYILDNLSNTKKFSTTVFKSDVDKDSFEIGALTFLKEYAKQEFDQAKKWLKDELKDVAKSAKEQLEKKVKEAKSTALKATEDVVTSLGYKKDAIQEVGDWLNKWVVPKRIKSESKELKDDLDPTKNMVAGYALKEAIALQMPNSSLTYTYENGWESTDTSTLNTIKTLIDGVSNSLKGLFGDSKSVTKAKKELGDVVTKITDAVGNVFTGGGWSASEKERTSRVANPVLAFNYTVPQPRTFSYKFTLYPRNKEELYTLFNLIQKLKFYSLPQSENTATAKDASMWFSYPAKFAIKFYTNGYENKWFPSTMALGLTSISETLTGDNGDMAFFENYFNKESGNPPRLVELTLNFKELGIMSRDYANAGY